MTLAIFDLDNALLTGDSDYEWGEFLASKGVVDVEQHSRANARFFADYKAGNLNMEEFIEFQLTPLKNHPKSHMLNFRVEFLQKIIIPMITDNATTLIEKHKKLGHTAMIITATNRFITAPIAELLGIDNLIATEVEEIDGCFTGRSFDVPSFGEGKVTRLRSWLEYKEENLRGSWFYSDSHNDLPLLRLVENPVALNPDPILREHATLNQWGIIDW